MPIVWTDVPEANQLLETDHLALLIGLVLDQQVKMEKAFRGPYDLKQRLGGLDVREIATMDPDKLVKVFRERPALHRFPGSMAARVQALCQVKILIAVLAKKFDVKPPGWEKHAANWHTVADVDSEESMAHAREVKREMKAGK